MEVEGYTVPHFKAPVYAKMELLGLECGSTFSIQTSLLNISHLLHKMGFVPTEVSTTVLPELVHIQWTCACPASLTSEFSQILERI